MVAAYHSDVVPIEYWSLKVWGGKIWRKIYVHLRDYISNQYDVNS